MAPGLNHVAVATDVSEMIGIAILATVKQHEVELGHPGRAVDGSDYPPSLAKDAARAVTDAMESALASTLFPLVPADAGAAVSDMICAGVQAAIARHELDLAHPGRATASLSAPSSLCAAAAKSVVDVGKLTLVTHLTTPDMVAAANDIMSMVRSGCRMAVKQHEVELGHPGHYSDADWSPSSHVTDAVTAAITPLVTQLITDLGGTPP